MPTVTVPQGEIQYEESGDPAGVPVVAVHGLLTDGDLWRSTADALGGRVRVVRPTLALGSHRTPVAGPMGPDDVAASLVAFVDALGLERPVLLGNDTGGAICQLAVAAAPDRFGGLVLTNCDAFRAFPPAPFNVLRPLSRVPGAISALMAGLRLPALRHTLFYGVLASRRHEELWARFMAPYFEDRAMRRHVAGLIRRVDPGALDAATRGLADWDGETLVVWGMRDRIFRPGLGRELAAVAGARLVEVPDAKAFVPLDAPDAVADAVAGFVAGLRPATAKVA